MHMCLSLLIPPLLCLNWRLDLVVKDCQQAPPHLPLCSSSSKVRDKSNHEQNILRYMAYISYSNTFLTQVGYVALANMFPWVVGKWNSSWNKVIFPIWHLSNLEFWMFSLRESIVHFILLKWHSQITQWCINPYQGIAMFCLLLLSPTSKNDLCGALGRDKQYSILVFHML